MAQRIKMETDRQVLSTDNNEFAEGLNDENLWEEDIVDVNVPIADDIPEGVDETGFADREPYNENGYREDRID